MAIIHYFIINVLILSSICCVESKLIKNFMDNFKAVKFFAPEFDEDALSEPCNVQMTALYDNLYNGGNGNWALRMIDASSKLQSGLITMNFGEIGNFEECITTKAEEQKIGIVKGKYCLGRLNIAEDKYDEFEELFDEYITQNYREQTLASKKSAAAINFELIENNTLVHGPSWATCVPHKCTSKDVNYMVNYMIKFVFNNPILNMTFTEEFCQTEDTVNQHYTLGATLTILFFSLYFSFLIGCTVYDIICLQWSIDGIQSLLVFSMYRNGKKLFQYTEKQRGTKIKCLDGLRFLSIMWVVLGHQYSITGQGPITNTSELINWANSLHSMFLINGTISVDTFLVIGSLLTIYMALHVRRNGHRFNILQYYFHRYIRLTPPLAAVVLMSSTLLVYMGSGPRWPLVKPYFQDNCQKYWWSTLLYIQNYVNISNMCVGQTWYLSVDVQMYIISAAILFGFLKYPKGTIWALIAASVLSMALAFQAAWSNQLAAILSSIFGNTAEYSNKYYLLTHTRAAPWFIGILFGYYIFQHQTGELRIQMRPRWVNLLWLLTISALIFCVFIGHGSLRSLPYNRFANSLHIALIRPLWSIAIGWLIFTCVVDQGHFTVFINNFLSLPIFQILNRLTYCIYLTHVTMMYLISFAKKTPTYFSDFEMGFQFWGHFMLNAALAVVWSLSFESPIMALEKIWIKPELDSPPPPSTSTSPSRELPTRGLMSQSTNTDIALEDLSSPSKSQSSPSLPTDDTSKATTITMLSAQTQMATIRFCTKKESSDIEDLGMDKKVELGTIDEFHQAEDCVEKEEVKLKNKRSPISQPSTSPSKQRHIVCFTQPSPCTSPFCMRKHQKSPQSSPKKSPKSPSSPLIKQCQEIASSSQGICKYPKSMLKSIPIESAQTAEVMPEKPPRKKNISLETEQRSTASSSSESNAARSRSNSTDEDKASLASRSSSEEAAPLGNLEIQSIILEQIKGLSSISSISSTTSDEFS